MAVKRGDAAVLAALAERLGKSEMASSILRAKRYGGHGQSIDLTVRDVPSRND